MANGLATTSKFLHNLVLPLRAKIRMYPNDKTEWFIK